jgi:Cu/Ag efflux protein CusF
VISIRRNGPRILLALALCLAPLLACGERGAEAPHRGHGIVREVHPETGEVVLQHGDISGLMKGMTMGFEVADPALLENLAPGTEVDFEVQVTPDGRYRVTSIERK